MRALTCTTLRSKTGSLSRCLNQSANNGRCGRQRSRDKASWLPHTEYDGRPTASRSTRQVAGRHGVFLQVVKRNHRREEQLRVTSFVTRLLQLQQRFILVLDCGTTFSSFLEHLDRCCQHLRPHVQVGAAGLRFAHQSRQPITQAFRSAKPRPRALHGSHTDLMNMVDIPFCSASRDARMCPGRAFQ
ncbi:hypothetical protein GQ600_8842 [Phytophthora cactorum]|nr:hypothetical protein GQ600_8842 [Phytophthora cactorum]